MGARRFPSGVSTRRPGPYDVRIGGTGADGIVVHIVKGWRTILCADGTEMKRIPASLKPAPGSPPAALEGQGRQVASAEADAEPKPPLDPRPRARRVPNLRRARRAPMLRRETQQRPKGRRKAPSSTTRSSGSANGGRRLQLIASGPCGASGDPGIRLLDDDELDTPMRKRGAWEVRWADRTESFVARSDVRVCVPTRERLKAEAQAPAPPPPKRARRVTESPQPRRRPAARRRRRRSVGYGARRRRRRGPRRPAEMNASADTRALAEYLRVCGAQDPEKLASGWTFSYSTRMFGKTAGTGDRYFILLTAASSCEAWPRSRAITVSRRRRRAAEEEAKFSRKRRSAS